MTQLSFSNHIYINLCSEIIKEFGQASGSRLNELKTKGLITGTCPTETDYSKVISPKMVLSVSIGKEALGNSCWETLICKVQAKLNLWSMRDLSLEGKVQIITPNVLASASYAFEMKIVNQDHVKNWTMFYGTFYGQGHHTGLRELCIRSKYASGLGIIDLSVLINVKRILLVIRML